MSFLEISHFTVSQSPPDLSELNPDVPKDLQIIINMMMAKNKRDRVQVSLDFIELIDSLQNLLALAEILKVIQHNLVSTEEDRIPVNSEKLKFTGKFDIPEKLYGREEQLQTLIQEASCLETKKKSRSINFLVGISGIGKTEIVYEVTVTSDL